MSPSFSVVVPVPDALNLDLSMVKILTLFLTFSFDFGFSFFSVVIKVAPVSLAPTFKTLSDFPPSVKRSLSAVRTSVVPSVL